MNRRQLIGAAAALCICDLRTSVPAEAASSRLRLISATTGRPAAVVYDRRYADSRRFALQMQCAGARVFETHGDAIRIWRTLQALVVERRACVAGLTAHSDFVLLSASAAEAGLRVRHHGVHDGRSGALVHTLRGETVCAADTALGSARWVDAMCGDLLRLPEPGDKQTHMQTHMQSLRITRTGRRASYPGTLHSWLLA